MIKELINQAVTKAGDKSALARTIKEQRPRISEYETHKRPPTDTFVLKLADYLGLDKGKTLYEVKKEIDPENAYLWQFMVRSAGLEPTPQASETWLIKLIKNPLMIAGNLFLFFDPRQI